MINKPRIRLFSSRNRYNGDPLYVRYVQLDLKDGSKPKVFGSLGKALQYVSEKLCRPL